MVPDFQADNDAVDVMMVVVVIVVVVVMLIKGGGNGLFGVAGDEYVGWLLNVPATG